MRLVILHGFGADPSSHWFRWLGDEVGGDVVIPALPSSDAPQRDAWVAATRDAMGDDGDVIVVGHSLGTVAALLAADSVDRARLRGVVLVAGFWEPLPALPELDDFLDLPPVPHLGEVPVVAIASDDDAIVPPAASARLAAQLGVPVETVPGAGHFLGREGWTQLPAASDAVLRLRDAHRL